MSYLPTAPGDYNIIVKFDDKHIAGSPFTAKITGTKTLCVSLCLCILFHFMQTTFFYLPVMPIKNICSLFLTWVDLTWLISRWWVHEDVSAECRHSNRRFLKNHRDRPEQSDGEHQSAIWERGAMSAEEVAQQTHWSVSSWGNVFLSMCNVTSLRGLWQ